MEILLYSNATKESMTMYLAPLTSSGELSIVSPTIYLLPMILYVDCVVAAVW